VFYILADLGWQELEEDAEPEIECLLQVKAYADGNIELQPPVQLPTAAGHPDSAPATKCTHTLNSRDGSVYECTIALHGSTAEGDRQAARRQQLWSQHEQAHAQHRRQAQVGRFLQTTSTRLFVQGDVVSAQGFEHDRLYIEFALRYPKKVWRLRGPQWLVHQRRQLEGAFEDDDTAHVRLRVLPACLLCVCAANWH
jgi:hypothetical protein